MVPTSMCALFSCRLIIIVHSNVAYLPHAAPRVYHSARIERCFDRILDSQHSKATTITNATIPQRHHLTTPLIPHKPKPALPLSHIHNALPLQLLNRRQHNTNWMSPAHRIPRLPQHAQPTIQSALFASCYTLHIHRLDTFMYGWIGGCTIIGFEVDCC